MSAAMKVRLDRAALADAVTWVGLAVSKRPHAPALAGLRLTATDESLTLHGYDFDVSHQASIPAEVLQPGEVLVSALLLRQIVASMKGKDVELVLDGQRLAITAGRSSYRIGVMRLDDFPALPAMPKRVGTVERAELADLVAMTEHAIARDVKFEDIMVLHLATCDGMLEATSTDRFRIAHVGTAWTGSDFACDIPGDSLAGALKGLAGEIVIGQEGGILGLSDGRRSVTTRLADVSFPRVLSFFATDDRDVIEVSAEDLAQAVKRAAMVAAEHAPIQLHITAGEIKVSADSESGEGSEVIEAETPLDLDLHLNFSAAYLADGLLASSASRVQLLPGGLTRPTLIRPLGVENAIFAVMPRKAMK